MNRDHLRWLLLTFVLASLSIFFSYYIFPSQASVLAITFIVIGLTPPLYSLVAAEEKIVAQSDRRTTFFMNYGNIIVTLLVISLGLLLAYSFWHAALPEDPEYRGDRCSTSLPCKQSVFSFQLGYPQQARGLDTTLGLMLICFALSLFLGAGAILIIAWDISSLAAGGFGSMGLLGYMPQLLGFFLTGMAGALLSFAIVRHEWKSPGFLIVIKDSLKLLGLSLALMVFSYFLLQLP